MASWKTTLREKDSVLKYSFLVVDWLPAAMSTSPINSRTLTSSVLIFHN